jgi:uncharacterized membrane protein affecting hemolysin expression
VEVFLLGLVLGSVFMNAIHQFKAAKQLDDLHKLIIRGDKNGFNF